MQGSQLADRATDFSALADQLEQIAEKISEAGDEIHSGKLRQLAEKVRKGEGSIAFCGHFSAGKSTMINRLLGVELLPSNPIPTSANVVKIRGGEKAARVYTRNSGVLTFDPDTQMDELKKYAVDGDTVEWVEVCYPQTLLDDKSSLLDTPGIDSTDAAHKIATESALHLADVVIYMMDYNHVQAEENFNFTKTLKDRGKPVYLVINMIDKHIDFELDFDSYKESVEEAFATWNIKPDGIFYTSLAEPDHPENQYEEFRGKLAELFGKKEELVHESVTRSARHLIDEHIRFLARQQADVRESWEAKLQVEVDGVDSADAKQVQSALLAVETEIGNAKQGAAAAKQQMEKSLSELLENARLTYYSTNEAAERYLESRKSGFKVGFLFAGKKTEEERAQRLAALRADLQEKVSANLDFHFKELVSKFPQAYEIRDEAYHAAVHALKIEVTPEFLAAQVKEGAGTREYVMNYCNDIAGGIKAEYRRAGLAFIEQVAKRVEEQAAVKQSAWAERAEALRMLANAHQELDRLAQNEKEAAERLYALLQ